MFCQNSENAEDHAPFLTPVTTGCAIRNVDPSFQCCYHQFQQSNKSLVKRSASSSNQINRWQKEMPLTFPTSLVVQLADPLITVSSASASIISYNPSQTEVSGIFPWINLRVAPLDGSSAMFDGVGILAYQGVVQLDISNFSRNSIKQFAVMFRPFPEMATSLAELLSTIISPQNQDQLRLIQHWWWKFQC